MKASDKIQNNHSMREGVTMSCALCLLHSKKIEEGEGEKCDDGTDILEIDSLSLC